MVDPAVFQMIIGFTGFAVLLFFLESMDADNPDSLKAKLMGAFLFYTLSLFSLLVPATTRQTYELFFLHIPPIQVWLEALTMAFLVAAMLEVFAGD